MTELATAALGKAPAREATRADEVRARDAELMAAIAAGDRRAFGQVYAAHAERAQRLAYGVLLDRDEAREVVQEAFFRLHQNAKRWEPNAALSTWLHRVVLNHCFSLRRRIFRFRKSETPLARTRSPEASADLGRAVGIVERTLAACPPRERAMLTLYLDEDMKPADIAAIVGLTPNATRVAIHRGVTRLREQLTAAGLDASSLPEESFDDLEEEP